MKTIRIVCVLLLVVKFSIAQKNVKFHNQNNGTPLVGKDNPIIFVDPDGMFDVRITGSQADEATKKLQETTALNLTRDSKTGLLSATGEAKSKSDKALLSTINDHSVEVNLTTTDKNSVTLTNGGLSGDLVVGAMGVVK